MPVQSVCLKSNRFKLVHRTGKTGNRPNPNPVSPNLSKMSQLCIGLNNNIIIHSATNQLF
uniref:Uncharacterized protein n=1 Tax=Anguilla anguilla TaxID=7936 RepID=A0A0E9S1Y5_ANGAN